MAVRCVNDARVIPRLLAAALALLMASPIQAAEFTTDNEGGPRITFVKLLRRPDLREYWAWVTLEHEDWPIENRRFLLHEEAVYPDLPPGTTRVETPDWVVDTNHEDRDRVYTRARRFPSPYRHYVDWWVVVGPKGEKVHRRDIEYPHPGGWPFTLLERGIKVPVGITQLTFKAHDPIHGYGPQVVSVDLLQEKGPGFEIEDAPPWKWSGRLPNAKKHMRSNAVYDVPELW